MNNKPTVKVIKNGKAKAPAIPADVESTPSTNRWSRAVRSWVAEFLDHDRSERLPDFESLFKDAPTSSNPEAESGSS